MNTDMNPENINPDSSDNLSADNEETQLMDTPDNPIAADVTAELPVAKDLEDAVAPDPDAATDDSQKPNNSNGLKRKLVAGGVALGIGLSLNHEAVNIPDNAPVASIVGNKDAKAYPASVTLTADGWSEGDGEFSYEVVDADGESAAKGDIVPGKEVSVDLPKGAYALNVTSIPTAKDGKTTWLVPDAVDFVVEGKGASVKVSLTKVDMTDDAAVDAAIEKLPEEERAAAKKLIEAKRENPNASAVSTPVSRPSNSTVQQAGAVNGSSGKGDSKPASKPSGSGSSSNKNDSKPSTGSSSNKGDSKPSGSNKNDKTDKPASKPDNSGNSGSGSGFGSSKPSEPEKVWAIVTPAWDEQIYHPAVTHVEKKKVGVQYMADDGKLFLDETECSDYCWDNGLQYSCLPRYQDVTVTDQEAWTETVHHEAVWGWVNK